MIVIDLLAIDLAAGKHWMDRVHDDRAAARLEMMRKRNRAAWLRERGRSHEAERLEVRVAEIEARFAREIAIDREDGWIK
jgi:hypothetical protein